MQRLLWNMAYPGEILLFYKESGVHETEIHHGTLQISKQLSRGT